ncbi:MAG: hypothetical protein M3406_09700 [Chloroflexota bacterium]|nr:hypothetical protein [Chloroflexota bacterium]
MPLTIVSRSDVASAAGLLLLALGIIVVDVRIGTFDVLADVIGGGVALVAVLKLRGAIRGADGLRGAIVIMGAISLPVTLLETFRPLDGLLAALGLSQVIGTLLVARLLADAFAASDPALAARWSSAFTWVIWLALGPIVLGTVVSLMGGGGVYQLDPALAIGVLLILLVPLIAVIRALWDTSHLGGDRLQ